MRHKPPEAQERGMVPAVPWRLLPAHTQLHKHVDTNSLNAPTDSLSKSSAALTMA